MPHRDLHSKPFDETTITKLEIFEDYAEAWIPTFVMQPKIKEIHVFDFFAGPGYDKNGVAGSPIRMMKKIVTYLGTFLNTKTTIVLHLNEFEPGKKEQEKFKLLKLNCEEFCALYPKLKYFTQVEYYNKDAESLFFELLPKIDKYPSLVYLDQNGVKFIAREFISELEKIRTVDFIYFVSSSYFWRFGGSSEFQKVLSFDFNELKRSNPYDVHRAVINKLKETLPASTSLKLFPFSLNKKPNIYGIIFGAKHYRAVDKFLDIAWKRNDTNGEADFDIDGELPKPQMELFAEIKLTKVIKFKNELQAHVLSGKIKTNKDALFYAYQNGHIPKHAADVLKELKRKKKVDYQANSPLITYDQVEKNKNIISYTITK